MKTRTCLTILSLAVCCMAASAGEEKKAKKPNPAFAPIEDDPNLPRVLLIGDSISIDYTIAARNELKGKANVHRIPENGGPTSTALGKIDKWLGDKKWDVIHFNWGLHDLKYMDTGKQQVPLEEYEKNLRALVERMKKSGAKLIWASTTPVPDAEVKPQRKNADVIAYNDAAMKIMRENKVFVDDLYAFALPKLADWQIKANVHFQEHGSGALGVKVADAIEQVLKMKKE